MRKGYSNRYYRHSGESRKPDLEQAKNLSFWIPTFVGMTNLSGFILLVFRQRLQQVPQQRPLQLQLQQ